MPSHCAHATDARVGVLLESCRKIFGKNLAPLAPTPTSTGVISNSPISWTLRFP